MTVATRPSRPADPGSTDTSTNSTQTWLSGDGLVLGFGSTIVVEEIDVRLRPGHVTALVGPNGSGKSTLLRALARLHPTRSGDVVLGTADHRPEDHTTPVSLLSARAFAREVTLFAQTRPAPHGLSVRDVASFGRHPYRRAFAGLSTHDRAVVQWALRVTGVEDMAHRAAGQLSGGELQRVWLAACLAQETGVVLLDEPTNHLDLRYQVETLDLVRDLAETHGVAVGVVLHDLDHAAGLADHVLLMAAGRVVAEGSPLEVFTASTIAAAYGVEVEVTIDEQAHRLRIDPVSRHAPRLVNRAQTSPKTSPQTTPPAMPAAPPPHHDRSREDPS